MVLLPKSEPAIVIADPLPVEIDAPIPVPTSITGQPISVTIPTPVPVTQTISPLPVDICPVSCDVPIINGSVSPLLVSSTVAPIGTPVGETIGNLTNFAYTNPNDVFVADLTPIGTAVGDSVIFRIMWSSDQGGKLSLTLNSTDFIFFNDQNALKEDSVHIFDIVVDHADTFNLLFEKDTTIIFLRVVQLI